MNSVYFKNIDFSSKEALDKWIQNELSEAIIHYTNESIVTKTINRDTNNWRETRKFREAKYRLDNAHEMATIGIKRWRLWCGECDDSRSGTCQTCKTNTEIASSVCKINYC